MSRYRLETEADGGPRLSKGDYGDLACAVEMAGADLAGAIRAGQDRFAFVTDLTTGRQIYLGQAKGVIHA